MITIKVYSNTFLNCIEKYKTQISHTFNNKGNTTVLFPSIDDLLNNLIFNLLETIRL